MTTLRYLALALPLAAAVWWWFGRSTPAVHAETQVVRPSALIAPGRIEPVHDPVRLAFEAQGRIAAIVVAEGDAVRAGQVLARLDDRVAAARVAAATAGLAQAKARYTLSRRGPRSEDIAAARAEADAAAAAAQHRVAEQVRSEHLGKVGALAT